MPRTFTKPQQFQSTIEGSERGRVYIPLTFDPATPMGRADAVSRRRHDQRLPVRGAVEQSGTKHLLPLGPAWRRGVGLKPGDAVDVTLALEGPQRDELPADIAAALNAEPEAAAFFDSLAGFYVLNYLRWIDATKRSPETRAAADRDSS